MKTEFEISFLNIDRDNVVSNINNIGGNLIKSRTLMKRVAFRHPTSDDCFARIRNEGDKITCTYKNISSGQGLSINSVKEIECEVSDFENLRQIFINMGIHQKAYQETYRETWAIGDEVYFMIDEWPGLKPFIEIEGKNEVIVQKYAKELGFNYEDGVFGAVDEIYLRELGLPKSYINSLEIITFDNPPKAKMV